MDIYRIISSIKCQLLCHTVCPCYNAKKLDKVEEGVFRDQSDYQTLLNKSLYQTFHLSQIKILEYPK